MSLFPHCTDTETPAAFAQIRFDDRGRAELHAAIDELLSSEPFFDRESRIAAYLVLDERHQRGVRTAEREDGAP